MMQVLLLQDFPSKLWPSLCVWGGCGSDGEGLPGGPEPAALHLWSNQRWQDVHNPRSAWGQWHHAACCRRHLQHCWRTNQSSTATAGILPSLSYELSVMPSLFQRCPNPPPRLSKKDALLVLKFLDISLISLTCDTRSQDFEHIANIIFSPWASTGSSQSVPLNLSPWPKKRTPCTDWA